MAGREDVRDEMKGEFQEATLTGFRPGGRLRSRALPLRDGDAGFWAREESQRGSLLVECALLLPVLLILMFGMVDFSRVFLTAIAVTSAAQAGAEYGSSSSSSPTDYTGMQNAAAHDAAQLASFTAIASQYCSCSPGGTSVSCLTSSCSGYGSPAKYVKVQTTSNFHTLFPYPFVPSYTTVNATAYMRVQ